MASAFVASSVVCAAVTAHAIARAFGPGALGHWLALLGWALVAVLGVAVTRPLAAPPSPPRARAARFTEFAERACGAKFTRAQHVHCTVKYDGVDPRDLRHPTDRSIARKLFGDVNVIPPEARAVAADIKGGRAGGSWTNGIYLLWRAVTADLRSLAPGEIAVALAVAPDMRLARIVVRYAHGACSASPSLRGMIQSSGADGFTIRRRDGHVVSIECLPASRGGASLRGRTLVGCVLDEAAFFRDSDFQLNDQDIFRAVAPRVIPGGMVVLSSTPWVEAGLLFEFWRDQFGKPSTAIVAHCPTELLRDDAHTLALVARERKRDPTNARREFDGEFLGAGSGRVFESDSLAASVDHGRPLALAPNGARALAGLDLGFASDSSVCTIVRVDGDRFEVAEVIELRPRKGRPLIPSVVVSHFLARCIAHDVKTVIADQHFLALVREHAAGAGLRVVAAPAGADGKRIAHDAAASIIHARRCSLPNEPRLLRQLSEVTARPTPGGNVVISSPRWRSGGHGDCASALVLALWGCSRFFDRRGGRRSESTLSRGSVGRPSEAAIAFAGARADTDFVVDPTASRVIHVPRRHRRSPISFGGF